MAHEIKNQRAVSCGAHIVQETCEVAGLIRIGGVFAAMREMAHHGDDLSHILKRMHNVQHRIARDLRWAADDCASTHHFKEAYKLRRRANKFEAKQ